MRKLKIANFIFLRWAPFINCVTNFFRICFSTGLKRILEESYLRIELSLQLRAFIVPAFTKNKKFSERNYLLSNDSDPNLGLALVLFQVIQDPGWCCEHTKEHSDSGDEFLLKIFIR